MPISQIVRALSSVIRAYPVMAQIRFRVLRDGLVTSNQKRVRIMRDWRTGGQLDMALYTIGDGEFTAWLELPLLTLAGQGEWVVVGIDDADPRRTVAGYMQINEGGTYTLNITSGGGGEATSPGSVSATTRVNKLPTSREVVILEKPLNGEWRVAGHGATPETGDGVLDLKVTDGSCYALGLDDFGVAFTSGLNVSIGQRVRPSVFGGVLYEITEGGVLPAGEPEWWGIDTDGSRAVGTARAIAVRYYQPLAHGPFPVELL